MWEAVVLGIQRIEPFYQLSRPDGAFAADSLHLNHTQILLPKVPFVSLRKKHYLVFVSFLCLLFVGILAPIFQSSLFNLNISTESAGVRSAKVKIKVLSLFQPGSVASLAAVTGPTLAKDLKDLDLIEDERISQILSRRRYKLCSLTKANGSVVYQLEGVPHQQDVPHHDSSELEGQAEHLEENPQKLDTIIPDARVNMSLTVTFNYAIMITASVLFGVEAFGKTSTHAVFSRKLVPVAAAIIFKQCWKPLDRGARNVKTFNHLSQRPLAHRENFNDFQRVFRSPCNIARGIKIFPGKAEDTIFLDYSSSSFLTAPIAAMLNGHFSVFLVMFVSWLVEVFTVAMGSLGTLPCFMHRECPSTSPTDVSPKAVSISVGLSFGILLTMTLMALFVSTPRLMASYIPQEVENMAGVLRWLHSSRMISALRPMSTMNPTQCREFRKPMRGRKFGLGWIGS
ncbi:uncharacterized protein PAC_02120 [Phialocephala subalpina]|uniref:Uncharacterized protein n=1 Tax=Phialocephala subalpina TaxID=576137 RepID=A0A1L7WHK1_9HELO|nr:uncharacterized protein PAC_02120 [Phialocephala subalpina]